MYDYLETRCILLQLCEIFMYNVICDEKINIYFYPHFSKVCWIQLWMITINKTLMCFFEAFVFHNWKTIIACMCSNYCVQLFVCLLLSSCLNFPKSTTLITLPNALMWIRNVQDLYIMLIHKIAQDVWLL